MKRKSIIISLVILVIALAMIALVLYTKQKNQVIQDTDSGATDKNPSMPVVPATNQQGSVNVDTGSYVQNLPNGQNQQTIEYAGKKQETIRYSAQSGGTQSSNNQTIGQQNPSSPTVSQGSSATLTPQQQIIEEKKYQTGILAQYIKETMVVAWDASDALMNLMSTSSPHNTNNNLGSIGDKIIAESEKIVKDSRIMEPAIVALAQETASVTAQFGKSIKALGTVKRDPLPVNELMDYQKAIGAYVMHPAKINKYLRDQKITVKPTDPVYFLQTIVY